MNLYFCFYFVIISIYHIVVSQETNLLDSEIIEDKVVFFPSQEAQYDILPQEYENGLYTNDYTPLNDENMEIGALNDIINLHNESSIELQPAIFKWANGIVSYYVDPRSYDNKIMKRIRTAMNMIERVSCVVFKPMAVKAPEFSSYMWLSIENPTRIRRCIHRVLHDKSGKATMIIGYECMQQRDILHSLMHVLGFHDEVTHPHRDNYVRIVWPNIQPQYRSLFSKGFHSRSNDLVEYDTTSIMHFHDRAYTNNGAPTIVPLVSGLKIRELESSLLSQLDVMKLKLAFGNDCNKRNVRKLYETCHAAIGEDKEDNNNGNYQDSKDFEDNQYTTDHRAIPEVSDGQGVEELSDGKESFEDLEFRDNIRSQNRQNGTDGQGGHDRAEKAVNPSPSPGVKQHFETLKNTTSKNVLLKS